ncbi:hypothetical protein BDW75DRAFT_223983 [Aspergillus navahoensis]
MLESTVMAFNNGDRIVFLRSFELDWNSAALVWWWVCLYHRLQTVHILGSITAGGQLRYVQCFGPVRSKSKIASPVFGAMLVLRAKGGRHSDNHFPANPAFRTSLRRPRRSLISTDDDSRLGT